MGMDIGSMGSGAGLSVMGIAQYLTGYLDQKKNKRPEYNIPGEFLENKNMAEQMALQGIGEQQKREYLSNIERGTAFGLREIGTRSGGLSGVAAINENQNKAMMDLMAADESARNENKRLVLSAREALGNEKKEQFQLNELNPFYERTAKNQALMGAGAQNLGNGIQTFGGGAGTTDNPNPGTGSGGGQTSGMSTDNTHGGGESGGLNNYVDSSYLY